MPAPADDRAGPGGQPGADAARPLGSPMGPHMDPVRAALEIPRLTVTRMAAELGIPRATLEAYRLGTRRMPVVVRHRLARYLAEHAALLRELAQLLQQD